MREPQFCFPIQLQAILEEIEIHSIEEALEHAAGNQRIAAELLCMKRTTLIMKMRKHGIKRKVPVVDEQS
jgi:DNA-binding NtrC family response regulator